MSMQLYIKYESTTLDLQANGYKVIDGFYPETPDPGAESVTDVITVLIQGSSATDLRAKIAAVTLALEQARRHKDDYAAAWLYFSVDNTNVEGMSKILDGEVSYNSRLDHNWRSNKIVMAITILHEAGWDAHDEIAVPLTNGNGTSVTTGLTVVNHDDAGTGPPVHDNWVTIDGDDIAGDMPGRTRLEVTNSYATNRLNTLWIGQNWTDPSNFTHILEGESSTLGSSQASAACSNGYYMRNSLVTGNENDVFKWTFSAGYLNACKGGYFKVLARWYGAALTNVKYRLKLNYAGWPVWQTGQITLDTLRATLIRDMFTLRLPPWLPGLTSLSALELVLSCYQSTGVTINLDLDFLQITPLDGWRLLECSGYGVAQNSRMMDDGVNQVAYIDSGAGSDKAGYLIGYGSPIVLYPGKDQKLYFLMHANLGDTAEIDRTASIKLYYRPRRRTI